MIGIGSKKKGRIPVDFQRNIEKKSFQTKKIFSFSYQKKQMLTYYVFADFRRILSFYKFLLQMIGIGTRKKNNEVIKLFLTNILKLHPFESGILMIGHVFMVTIILSLIILLLSACSYESMCLYICYCLINLSFSTKQ